MGQVARSARPVTTVVESRMPCWSSACHIAGAVVPAHATNTRSGLACFTCAAKGVKSVALSGTRTLLTVWPLPPRTAWTAATLPLPNAESWAKTSTFLPAPLRYEFAARTSW